MTNHVVGEDRHGIWGTCYGWVQWTHNDKPGHINRAAVLYRDRLRNDEERGLSPGASSIFLWTK